MNDTNKPMTALNGHRIQFIEDTRENYLEACHHYLFLAFNGADKQELFMAANAIFRARSAYVR